nr:Ger(x)C family spore germination C-terminal domain-containing protein [Paenibacillus sp. YYML68]
MKIGMALVSTGKIQNLLISRKVLQHEDWYKLLDVFKRDSQNRSIVRVIAVDGSIEEIMFFKPKDKGRLSLFIAKLIDTANKRNIVMATPFFMLNRHIHEQGITPYLPEIRLNAKPTEIQATGTALLNKQGQYVTTISLEESSLLHMLQKQTRGDLSLSLKIPEIRQKKSSFEMNVLSFYCTDIKRKVKTSHTGGTFRFDITLSTPIFLTERIFPFDVDHEASKLEQMINVELERKYPAYSLSFKSFILIRSGLGYSRERTNTNNGKRFRMNGTKLFPRRK